MSDFSVNTDKINNLADLLDKQAKKLEKYGNTVNSVSRSLHLRGSAKAPMMSALKTTSANIKDQSQIATQMGTALKQIAAAYRTVENKIARYGGYWSPSSNHSSTSGSSGNSDGSGTQNGNNKDSGTYSKDPVNLNTGNFILDNQDMEIPGNISFVLGRFYNSMSTFSGALGNDWNTSFEARMFLAPSHHLTGNDVCVMLEDGREEYFASADGVHYIPVSGSTAELTKINNNYQYQSLNGDIHYFDSTGVYTRFENPHHVGFNLFYENQKLQKVQKDSGEFYIFSYNEEGLLEQVEDHIGRSCHYLFEKGHLKEVILPDGGSYIYSYNQYGKVNHVVNPRSVDAVETEYDDLHRVVYQKFADGTTNHFEYLDAEMAVIMTERNGSKSTHYHNEKYQNVRNVYSDGEESFVYNERGLKTILTDKLGNTTRVQYDNRGNVTEILTAEKNKFSATYNPQNLLLTLSVNGMLQVKNKYNEYGDLVVREDGLGRKTTYQYDEDGQLIRVQKPDNSCIWAEYDKCGNLIQVTDAAGEKWIYTYSLLNQITDITDPLGHANHYDYDIMGRLTSHTRADGNRCFWIYDERGNLVSSKDYAGNITTRVYNENDRPVSVTDPLGYQVCYEYDSMWNVNKVSLPNDAVFQWFYNENNYLEKITDPLGGETLFTYDPMGNILTRTDAEGHITEYTWDSDGHCTSQKNAEGFVTEYKYDADGQLIYIKDPEGTEMFRTFDMAGQLIFEENSAGQSRKYRYNENGNIISVTDEKNQETIFSYRKGMDNVSTITHPDGTQEHYSYDSVGNQISYTDIYGTTLTYQYDVLNRLVTIRKSDGSTAELQYDLLGNIITGKDFNGNSVHYTYSSSGQLTSVTDPLGNITTYKYNSLGKLIEIHRKGDKPEETVHLTYQRDKLGQITGITDALGRTETYKYDKLGHMIEKTDRDDFVTKYNYTPLGMLQKVNWNGQQEATYEYTAFQLMKKMSDWTGSTNFKYTITGELQEILYPDGRKLSYEYDVHRNRTGMIYPDGKRVDYVYDSLNRLQKLVHEKEFIDYTYDKFGNLSEQKYSDGRTVDYTYTSEGYLEGIIHKDENGILDKITLGYDNLGRKNQYSLYRRDLSQENGEYSYFYDAASRLEKVTKNQEILRTYAYDSFGNRTSMEKYIPDTSSFEKTDYFYDLSGALTKIARTNQLEEFSYDGRGNVIDHRKNGRTVNTYQYDALNRLIHSASDKGQASYQYNGLGYRTQMHLTDETASQTVSYVSDYSQIYDNLVEKSSLVSREDYLWGNGLDGFSTQNGIKGWYLTDTLGSVLRKTEASAPASTATLYMANYDEFGNILSVMGKDKETFGYNGFQRDDIAGTWFAQARQYRSRTGTFDGMDHIAGDIMMPETLNLYNYCVHDPLNHTDKSGYYFGVDDAIAAGLGAFKNVAGVAFGDMITSVTTGQLTISSWQKYVGEAAGGAVGTWSSLYISPIGGAAIDGGVSTFVTESLTMATDPNSSYTWSEIAVDTAVGTGKGAVNGVVAKCAGKVFEKVAKSNVVQNISSKLQGGNKVGKFIADKISDIATGKKGNWETVRDFIKNKDQLSLLKGSSKYQDKLFSLLLSGIPVYMWDAIKDKFKKALKKTATGGSMTDKLFDKFSSWLKDKFGIGTGDTSCVAAAGSFGGGGGGGGLR